MTEKQMMTLPIKYRNLMMAKAEALDDLIEKGIVDKQQIVEISGIDWYGGYLANEWGIETND
ncbi:TPA: hypothetical protein TYI17_000672 [Streptococcus suis]|uniref:hypothetical protein n=1 Tax=Streptococcus suis TaxID=1307 RepID=UPI0009448B9C|nr:hypothetical protein [Streptococcus suis]HEL1931447.1 hypothetical protein [Streptococcus suis]HEL2449506.1 hypothetical protein [Streptococcus suis]